MLLTKAMILSPSKPPQIGWGGKLSKLPSP
jgi:hypothetical protein